jgi:hypothetical protein
MKSILAAALAALVSLISLAAPASAGVSGPAFYVDGVLYRTVATPTDLSDTGAPDSSFDIIYNLGGAQDYNVAEAAPGDRDFNGGRWQVHRIVFDDYESALDDPTVDLNGNGVLDSDAEVLAAVAEDYATDLGVIREFVCTVVRVPASQ